MPQLYTTLARVYHEMYQHIFDYDEEFRFYDDLLRKNRCQKILEVGCGSGMLARRFLANGYDYTGLDVAKEMLAIAREEIQQDVFVQSNMSDLRFSNEFDAGLITGRSLAYVTGNKGIGPTVNEALGCTHQYIPGRAHRRRGVAQMSERRPSRFRRRGCV